MRSKRDSTDVGGFGDAERVNRLYAVLSEVNEAIVRIHEPQALYDAACKIAVDHGHFIFAWIGFVEPGAHSVRWAAKYGRDEGYLDTVKISLDPNVPEGRGPTGVALRGGRPFINNDTENNPIMQPWRDEQLKRGYRSSASFPLRTEGKTVGVITLYAAEPDYFDEEEIRLLECLADDFSFALESAEIARQRAKALEGLRESHDELEARVVERTALAERELENTRILQRLASAGANSLSLREIGDATIAELRELPEVAAIALYALDEQQGRLRGFGIFGYSGELAEWVWELPVDDSTNPGRVATHDLDVLTHEDPGNPPESAARLVQMGIPSARWIAMPLRKGGKLLGTFSLIFHGERSFEPWEAALIRGIADTLSGAVDNARLYEAQQNAERQMTRELERTTLLQEVTTAATSSLSLPEIGEHVLALTSERLGTSAASIYALEEAAGELRALALVGYPKAVATGIEQVRIDEESAIGHLVLHDLPLITHELGFLPPGSVSRARRMQLDVKRWLALPIKGAEGTVGVLAMVFEDRRAFEEDELSLYRSVARLLGASFENARLYEAAERNAEKARVLAEAASSLATSMGIETVMPDVLADAANVLGAMGGSLSARERGGWRTVAAHGFLPDPVGEHYTDEELPTLTSVCETRAISVVCDVDEAVNVNRRLVQDVGYRSCVSYPVIYRDEVTAVLSFFFDHPTKTFSDEDRNFVSRLAFVVGVTEENVRLLEEERRAARSAKTLATINEILLSAQTPDEVMSRLVGEASEAAGADKCFVIEVRDGYYTVTHVRNVEDDLVGKPKDASFYPAFALAAEMRRPVLIGDNWVDPRTNKDFVIPYQLRAFQLIPLIVDATPVAVLALAYEEPHEFGPEDEEFCRRVGAAMSLALRNSRLYDTEHRIAETLQEALLSLPDRLPGIEFTRAYHSATQATRVGGDFYDVFKLHEGLVGITIGDVAGKGLDAAVLTSLVRNTIRAHAAEKGKTPARILSLTNEVVYSATRPEAFVTVFFALLDCRDGRTVYANAGHPSAAMVSGDGTVSKLLNTGPLLGAFAGVEFEQAEVRLEPDDMLFLYTDGLTEANRERELYGEDRLFAFLSTTDAKSTEDLVDEVIADVMSFCGNRLRDDLAILAVRRLDNASEAPVQQKLEMW